MPVPVWIGPDVETSDTGPGAARGVTGTSVVRWDASGIEPGAAGRKLVLATCWPLDAKTAGPMRYMVHAEMMDQAAGPSADVDR